MIWLYIIGGLFLSIFIFLISYTKMHLEINVTSIHTQLRVYVVYKFWFKKFRQEYLVDLNNILNLLDSLAKDSSDGEKKSGGLLEKYITTKETIIALYDFLKKTKVDDFTWETTIGFQDADKTGLFSGSLWTIKGMLISLLSNIASLKKFHINVTPNFSNYEIHSHFKCILRIRIVHIIGISIVRWLSIIRGYYHGIRSSGKADRSSHRRFDENCYG